jgi:hypothetical protein
MVCFLGLGWPAPKEDQGEMRKVTWKYGLQVVREGSGAPCWSPCLRQ